MNSFDYNTPLNTEISNLALSRGEELLGAAAGSYDRGRSCDYRRMRLHCGHFQDVRVTHYRNGGYSCQECFKNKLEDLAVKHDLVLVSMDVVRYGNERLYRRLCGHTEIKSHSYLEKHKLTDCQECLNDSIRVNLERQNFTMVSRVKNGSLISCNTCGNTWTVRNDTASKGNPMCDVCFEKELEGDASAAGFTYLKDKAPLRNDCPSRTTICRWYSCNECGHIDTFHHSSMRTGSVRCSKCYLTRLQSDAEAQGMVYLGHAKGMMHNYKLPCGCFRPIQPFDVQRGVWACKVHDDTFYHRPSGIYLLEISSENKTWLKLGFAKDIEIRTKGYGLIDGTKCSLLFYCEFTTGYEAMEIEKSIHKEMANYKLESKEMKKYMTNTGHTECYPLGVKNELLQKLERLKT